MSAPRRPTAFRLDEIELAEAIDPAAADEARLVPEAPNGDAEINAPIPRPRRGFAWGRLLLIGLGGLAGIAAGLAVDRLIGDAFARAGWLGWLTAGLGAIALIAFLAFAAREIRSLFRLAHIAAIQRDATAAVASDRRRDALAICARLTSLYRDRPETELGRRALAGHMAEIIDGRDLVALAERELLTPLDVSARRAVLAAARRVSLVTAVSPRAVLDIGVVAFENVRLMRRIAYLYGGRPGTLGFFRLGRSVLLHLTLTGGMAAGETFIQQIVGQGLAARLSARLGEGLINGMLTARVGLAAIEVSRPLPFLAAPAPRLADMLGELARSVGANERDDQASR